MRTTVTLDRELVDDVVQVSNTKKKTRAVTVALQEYVRRKKLDRLRGLLGTLHDVAEQDLTRLRAAELEETRDNQR